jgi:hypothetical protein
MHSANRIQQAALWPNQSRLKRLYSRCFSRQAAAEQRAAHGYIV